jgi:heptosyltransferase-2
MKNFLIIQTAFLGDVILTLPLVQVMKRKFPDSQIDFLAIPSTSEILKNHPDISELIIYDKHGKQKSFLALLHLANKLRRKRYEAVLCPHRSLRSCLITKFSEASIRVGFDNSALRNCFTDVLPWNFGVHEVERNLFLLMPLSGHEGLSSDVKELPKIFPSDKNIDEAKRFFFEHDIQSPFAVVAPGTRWFTKRYPIEMMVKVVRELTSYFESVVIVGGTKDKVFEKNFERISKHVVQAIGKFSIMTSAEIIRHASLLIANDSAPIHIASAFNVPTVAIFGPTVRDFGFTPYHDNSAVVEIEGLSCRPCSIHGGPRCPIRSFKCMKGISPDLVIEKALSLLRK